MIVAGVGFRKGTSADEVEEVVRLALAASKVARIDVLATEVEKAKEPAVAEVAKRLAVALVTCHASELEGVVVPTPSMRVVIAKGVPSISEASAIVAAGRNARLLGARVATAGATCALAEGEGR